jgi:mRNA interferase MazF
VVIRQGDVYWIDLGDPAGSGPGYRHPHVVVQNDIFNLSRISTVVVCALTSNLGRAKAPGNALLEPGEGGLPKRSVVNTSQLFTVDKRQLAERIGSLSKSGLQEVITGVSLLLQPREVDWEGRP